MADGDEMGVLCSRDLATLIWVANLATNELHPFFLRVEEPAAPTAVIFDLDPGLPADIVDCSRAALYRLAPERSHALYGGGLLASCPRLADGFHTGTWNEVERTAAEQRPELLTFEPSTALKRIARLGDPFRPVLELEQRLPEQRALKV
jgi:DNA primase